MSCNRWLRCDNCIAARSLICARHVHNATSETNRPKMSAVWKTKYGPRRVRHDPPTLEEAIAAAKGLTDDVQAQVEIAASLMDLPVDQVRPEVLKAATPRQTTSRVAFIGRAGTQRAVVVERKAPRRVISKPSLGRP